MSLKFAKILVVFLLTSLGAVAQDQPQETELVLEQGVNAYVGARDATIFSEGALSNGGGQYLFSGNTGQSATRRALIDFDLTAVPQGATITAASFFLTVSKTRAAKSTQSLHRLTSDWGEGSRDAPGQEGGGAVAQQGDATWTSSFHKEIDWSQSGGDFVKMPSATAAILGTGTTAEWTGEGLIADVQSWVNGETENFGWILVGDESRANTTKRYFSSNNTKMREGQKPRLVIRFTN